MKNTPIRIIDSNFNLLGEIDDYESLQFIRKFYSVGEFELHININKNNTDKLQEDNLIIIGSDIKKVGVIRHREINVDEQGIATEGLMIKGYTLKGIVSRRLTIPIEGQGGYDRVSGTAETVIKHYVNNNCINPLDPSRKIEQLVLAQDLQRGKSTPWQTRYEGLSDVLQQIGEFCDIGWDIWLDIENSKFKFDIVEGRNLTANQDLLPPVIFSVDFDNIKGQTYVDSAIDYKNVGYAGGKGEEENRLIQQIGEASGLARIESFLDCSDAEDVDSLEIQGQKKLSEFKKLESFESQIIDFGSFIYGQDWELGDIVTVQNRKWGVTLDSRVVEVKEIYEVGGFQLEATFGNNIPTIIDKIKKIMNTPMIEKSNISVGDIKTSELQNDAGFITAADIPKINTYPHNQIIASSVWNVKHDLNRYPSSITIVDSAGSVVWGDIRNISVNELTISFTAAFAGNAYIS